jgi:putative membrane protein
VPRRLPPPLRRAPFAHLSPPLRRAPFAPLFGALVASQVAYSKIPPARRVAATRGIVGLMLATSLAEARGRRGGVVAAGGIGFAAELLGVATGRPFGHYTYSEKLGPRVRGVPVLAAAAWAMMARPSWIVAGWIARRRAARVAVAAGALTAWDVFLDPRMVREGYWTWPGGGRYEDVPLSNFLGWLVTGAGVFAVWSLVEGRGDGGDPKAGPFPADAGRAPEGGPSPADDGALALYLWTWVGETFANAVLWRRPRVALAGAVAMGCFAAPALRARLSHDRSIPTGPLHP